MKKDFVEVTPISGSNNGSFNVVCEVNKNESRSTVIIVEGGEGIFKSIHVTQDMNDKVYPLAYYIFPFTAIENYSIKPIGDFYYIIADAHMTEDVIIKDNVVGLYNLKALKPDIDLANGCILKQACIGYDYDETMGLFIQNVAGWTSSTQDNGVGFATIPENNLLEFTKAVNTIINSRKGYIDFTMIFGTITIAYRINILPN